MARKAENVLEVEETEQKQVAGKPMTTKELEVVTRRIGDKRGALHEDDHPLPEGEIMITDDGRKIQQIGKFRTPAVVGHGKTLERFARIEPDFEEDGWVPMTHKEAMEYQEAGTLAGYDHDHNMGKLQKAKTKKKGKN